MNNCTPKTFDNLNEMDQFLETLKLPTKQVQIPLLFFCNLQAIVLFMGTTSLYRWQEIVTGNKVREMEGHMPFISLFLGITDSYILCQIYETIFYIMLIFIVVYGRRLFLSLLLLWWQTFNVIFDKMLNLYYLFNKLKHFLFIYTYISTLIKLRTYSSVFLFNPNYIIILVLYDMLLFII